MGRFQRFGTLLSLNGCMSQRNNLLYQTCAVFVLCSTLCSLYLICNQTNLFIKLAVPKAFNTIVDKDATVAVLHQQMPNKFKGQQLPFHQIYESRRVGLSKYKKSRKNILSPSTKIILLWTHWNHVRRTINYYSLQQGTDSFTKYNCPNTKCKVTQNRKRLAEADVVLFHLLDVYIEDLPTRTKDDQLWILYDMEPPWLILRHHKVLSKLDGIFNYTMSYREDSDIVVRYGFIEALLPNTSKDFNKKFSVENKKSVVWFVSDCKTDSRREEYAKELGKYIEVHTYGKCGDKHCYPSQSTACYDDILEKYQFYLSFENAICKDYVTEKFFNAFNYDVVPIVFGGANYSKIAPVGTYLDATKYPKPKDLAEELHRISADTKLLTSMLSEKSHYISYLDPWTCKLCDFIHQPYRRTTKSDLNTFWIKESQCQRWTLEEGYQALKQKDHELK